MDLSSPLSFVGAIPCGLARAKLVQWEHDKDVPL